MTHQPVPVEPLQAPRATAAPRMAGQAARRLRAHPGAAVVWCVVAARLASWAAWVLTAPGSALAGRTPDDAYYYVVIARNLAATASPSFDGVDPTNGYHPLWQFTLAAAALVVRGTALVRFSLLVCGLLVLVGYLVLAGVARAVVSLSPLGLAVGALVVTGPLAWERLANGMEGAAVTAVVALVAWASLRWWRRPTARAMAVVGVACGLLCLARTTQAGTVALVPLLLLGARPGDRPAVRPGPSFLVWCGAVVAVVAPWFVWSWSVVGTPVSSAARVKTFWQHQRTGSFPSIDGLVGTYRAVTAELWRQVSAVAPGSFGAPDVLRRTVLVVLVASGVWAAARMLRRDPASVVVIAPVTAVVVRVAVELAWLPDMRASWYSAPAFVATALAVALVTSRVGRALQAPMGRHEWRRAAAGLAAAAVAVTVVLWPSSTVPPDWGRANWEAAQYLVVLPAGARIGSYDTGSLGFVRPGVVNLDGLVRGATYVDRLTGSRPAAEVILDERLDYLVGRLEPGDPRLPECARRVWRSTGTVEVGGRREPVRLWTMRRCGSAG